MTHGELSSFREIPEVYGYPDEPGDDPLSFVVGPVPDNILAIVFNLLQKDGLLPVFFYEKVPTIEEFLAWVKSPSVNYTVGFVGISPTLDKAEVAGIGIVWDIISNPGPKRGEVGMAFLRKHQVNDIPRVLASKMIDFAFDKLGFDILAGVTPVINRPAIRFIDSVGFNRAYTSARFRSVNGRQSDCAISYISKSEWMGRSR